MFVIISSKLVIIWHVNGKYYILSYIHDTYNTNRRWQIHHKKIIVKFVEMFVVVVLCVYCVLI